MFLLNQKELSFPDPAFHDPPEGLLAVGGDVSVERVLLAYKLGIFPWFDPGYEPLWWCPNPRFVLFPNELKVSKSMNKILEKGVFSFSVNQEFEKVINACEKTPRKDQEGTWISEDLKETMIELHKMGIAKSVEIWQDGALVGGLYGLEIGNVFCGESMYATVSNASKAGFIHFVRNTEYELIDCQVYTLHLESLGAKMISKNEYLRILNQNV